MSDGGGETARQDLSFVDVVAELWARKLWLVLIPICSGLITFLILSQKPVSYTASASLGVRVPRLPREPEAPPLEAEVLLLLAESEEMKSAVYLRLEEEGKIPNGLTFSVFETLLSAAVVEGSGRGAKVLPLVQLTARSRNPDFPMQAVNTWADIVLENTRSDYTSRLADLGDFMGNMDGKARDELSALETELSDKTLEAEVELHRALSTTNRKQAAVVYGELLDLRHTAALKEASIRQIRKSLGKEEADGRWIGEALYAAWARGEEEFARVAATAGPSTATLGIADSVRRVRLAERDLADLMGTSGLQAKERELASLEAQVELALTGSQGVTSAPSESPSQRRIETLWNSEASWDQKEKSLNMQSFSERRTFPERPRREAGGRFAPASTKGLFQLRGDLAHYEKEYAALSAELEGMSETIALNRAVGGEGKEGEGSPRILKTETVNPVYVAARGRAIELGATIEGVKERIVFSAKALDGLRETIAGLSKEVSLVRSERDFREGRLDSERAVLKTLELSYQKSHEELGSFEKERDRALAEAEGKEAALEETMAEGGELEERAVRGAQEVAALTRDIKGRLELEELLTVKAQEIALLNLSTKESTRSGVYSLYRAQPNPIKAPGRKSQAVIAIVIASFMLLSILFVLGKLIREA